MAEEILLSAIEQQAGEEAEGLLRKARGEERVILEEAKRHADEIEARLVRQRESEFKRKRLRQETHKVLERRQAVTSLKARSVEAALAQAQEGFRALQDKPEYETLFKKLLKELIGALGETKNHVSICVGPKDEKVAKSAVKALSLKAEVETDPALNGGVELVEKTENIRLRNTFETRVARSREKLIQRLNELLFKDVRL